MGSKNATSSAPDSSVSDNLDKRLASLRRQIGEPAWRERVAKAREREVALKTVDALRAEGRPLTEALRVVGVSRATLRQWSTRYRQHGLLGLVDRTGRTPLSVESASAPSPWRRRRRTKRAISFIKWAGSKAGVLRRLLPPFPREYRTYYEPMAHQE